MPNKNSKKNKQDKILEIMNKVLKLIQENMNQNSELIEKHNKLINKVEMITKTAQVSEKATELLKERKIFTKTKLMEELGMSGKYWRGWNELRDDLYNNPKVNIHPGTGRSETILIYTNEESSLLSLSSRLFKSLKKGKNYNLNYIQQAFNVNQEKAIKILNEASKIFKGRIEKGYGGNFRLAY